MDSVAQEVQKTWRSQAPAASDLALKIGWRSTTASSREGTGDPGPCPGSAPSFQGTLISLLAHTLLPRFPVTDGQHRVGLD